MSGEIRVVAPASIGNISVGFDCLGLCLKRIDGEIFGDEVSITYSDETSFKIEGPYKDKLPSDIKDNIIYYCHEVFSEELNQKNIKLENYELILFKNLPIGSGVGSSSSSIVASLVALNRFYNNALNKNELLALMGKVEGHFSGDIHYDNVAPCFLGGLQLMQTFSEEQVLELPTFDDWYWVVCYSGASISTKDARELLGTELKLSQGIKWAQYISGFIHASHKKDSEAALKCIVDVVAQDKRKGLLNNFDKVEKESKKLGAKAFGISGSGPSVFAVCTSKEEANRVKTLLEEQYIINELGFCHICQVDPEGVADGLN